MNVQTSPGFLRYYQRDRLELKCRLITPLFLGNARQEAEWRAAPFKALLRYWWRVSQLDCNDQQDLLKKEGKLFGAAGEGEEKEKKGKSLIEVRVISEATPKKYNLGTTLGKVFHPELEKPADKQILPLSYLAGMGLMRPDGQVNHSYFPTESTFSLVLDFPSDIQKELEPTLALVAAFGALGARCRNGWGSFQIEQGLTWSKEELMASLEGCTKDWWKGFDKDYPNCLGLDNKGKPLLWKTSPQDSWEKAMRALAEAYIAIRTGNVSKKISKLDPGPGFAKRHLLGVPLTNHPVNIERHASPLRLVVRRTGERNFNGFILHLPFRFAGAPQELDSQWQMEVWQQVHQGLDKLLARAASYGDCL